MRSQIFDLSLRGDHTRNNRIIHLALIWHDVAFEHLVSGTTYRVMTLNFALAFKRSLDTT